VWLQVLEEASWDQRLLAPQGQHQKAQQGLASISLFPASADTWGNPTVKVKNPTHPAWGLFPMLVLLKMLVGETGLWRLAFSCCNM
jgi:hypothetical protein